MNTERIKEIQKETGYPDSVSVQQALLKVWNECEQEKQLKNCNLQNVSQQRELLFAFGKYLQKRNISDFTPQMFIDDFLSEQ